MTTTVKPLFEHDCEDCEFLGQFTNSEGDKGDGYICPGEPTIVWRYGDDGPQYCSLDPRLLSGAREDNVLKAVLQASNWKGEA